MNDTTAGHTMFRTTHHLTALLMALALSIASLAGCGGDETSSPPASTNNGSAANNGGSACQLGFLGCDCIAGTACYPGSGWVCLDGVCKEPECAVGSEGCGCYANNTCDTGENGVALRCDESGICRAPECPEGSLGCPCVGGQSCFDNLACQLVEGVALCEEPSCPRGEEGCVCNPDNTCDDEGLACAEGRCAATGCVVGREGCACGEDFACDGGLRCNDDEVCEVIGCTPGAIGCLCDGGACRADTAFCDNDGRCQRIDCPAGEEGCACATGDQCGLDANGNMLVCRGGVCESTRCAVGEAGCACEGGYLCDGDLVCDGGLCRPADCQAAEEHCACAGGGCGPNLHCLNGTVCVDDAGYLNGSCLANNACYRGGRCDGGFCRACRLGTEGCACDEGTCNAGFVCQTGVCVNEAEVQPTTPRFTGCSTPCRSDYDDGVSQVACVDGFAQGCFGAKVCQDGSCVDQGEQAPTCASDIDCQSNQRCYTNGRCYTQCYVDEHCDPGYGCHGGACRLGCSNDNDDAECPSGFICDVTDGPDGFCVPQVPAGTAGDDAEDGSETHSEGSVRLSTYTVELTNTSVSGSFQIPNDSETLQTYRLRKLNHAVTFADNTTDRAVRANDGAIVCDPDTDPGCACDPDDPTDCTCTDCRPCDGDASATSPGACVDDGTNLNYTCNSDLGTCRPAACVDGICPLYWLDLGQREALQTTQELLVSVEPGQSLTVQLGSVDGAEGYPGVRWEGDIEVYNEELGQATVHVTYHELPEGHWSGNMVYLANFDDSQLQQWLARPNPPPGSTAWDGTRNDSAYANQVGNALIQTWVSFRAGTMSWDEFQAVLTATRTESYKWANVQSDCRAAFGSDAVCYLYDQGRLGLRRYSDDGDAIPVPDGVSELPITMNLRLDPEDEAMTSLVGKITSAESLQYAGDPQVELTFHTSPNACSLQTSSACIVLLEEMKADVAVGGRYISAPSDTGCAWGESYLHREIPWLVPGFVGNTSLDEETGKRYRYECRDTLLPMEGAEDDPLVELENISLSLSNPIPDGRPRRRSLTMLDGALINQTTLFVLFEEHFESFLADDDTAGFSAYGYMVLTRKPTDIDDTDSDGDGVLDAYQGSVPSDERSETLGLLDVSCDEDLLDGILQGGSLGDVGAADTVVQTLLTGIAGSGATALDGNSDEVPHYYCVDTNQFDGGPGVLEDNPAPCPVGSEVIYFTADRTRLTQPTIVNHSCTNSTEDDDTCSDAIDDWLAAGKVMQRDPIWRCTPGDGGAFVVYCDDDRRDLLSAKTFYADDATAAMFVPLQTQINDAFRYKTRFTTRRGTTPGFAPEICQSNSEAVPYCYDPALIESIFSRIDCLLHIQDGYYDQLASTDIATAGSPPFVPRDELNAFLMFNYAYTSDTSTTSPTPITRDGFEYLLAELLIMLGDESYTRAFASRFDLANSAVASFEGRKFEGSDDLENVGVDLSGIAGFELYSLHQAVQYYQMTLDRFYAHSPLIWKAISSGATDRNFVTPETIVRYFDRLIRASTQKSKAWAQIAQKYRDLNEPELARRVAERAYTATYLESIVLSRMMLRFIDLSALPEDEAQIEKAVVDAVRRYRSALLDMQNVHSSIEDNVTTFGFAPDYVPLPPLDTGDYRQSNAFEAILLRAQSLIDWAKEREQRALESGRSYQTDQAQFQSELTQLERNYENQLAELCGTFEANGRIYPAIQKYAYLDPTASVFGDPCGRLGNGDIHEAFAQLKDLELEAQRVIVQMNTLESEIDIERNRVARQCGEIEDRLRFEYGDKCALQSACDPDTWTGDGVCTCDADDPDTCYAGTGTGDDFQYANCTGGIAGKIVDLREKISNKRNLISRLQSLQGMTATALGAGVQGVAGVIAAAAYSVFHLKVETVVADLSEDITDREREIGEAQNQRGAWITAQQCDFALIDSNARTATLALRETELELQALRVEYRIRLALSNIERLAHRATRLQMEQAEAEELQINVQAAHNNPNIRIYKNDSIINAEIAFEAAVKEVYRLTRVFEYYTSQTYAQRDDLFLVRMVSVGDPNLENYLAELRAAFYEFEELFGHPSSRVIQLSLRDDVLAIPYLDENGDSLSSSERTALLREALTDVSNLDANGYIVLPFSTNLKQLSPLTRNHKILSIEANIDASDFGDHVARLYVRQKGTGTIHSVTDEKNFYRFDERTSVVNAFFNGKPSGSDRYFNDSIYPNYRLRDRPMANTHWELVINQRDELANQDINLQAITDIKLYIYYSDATTF